MPRPGVPLAASLILLNRVIPERTKATARAVVRRIVNDVMKRLALPLRQAVTGALTKGMRNTRPKFRRIDWHRTIRANLQHYQSVLRTIIPEKLIGYGRPADSVLIPVSDLYEGGDSSKCSKPFTGWCSPACP